MEKLDVAITIAGAAVLAVAVAGSALTGSTGGGSLYTLAFPLSTEDAGSQTKDIASSGTAEYSFEVKSLNVSSVEVRVDAVESVLPHVQPDTFSITVTSPDGTEATGTSSPLSVDVANAPPEREVRAPSGEAAAASAPAPSKLGVGTWKVRIDLTHPDPTPAPHSVKVTLAASVWSAKATPQTATPK